MIKRGLYYSLLLILTWGYVHCERVINVSIKEEKILRNFFNFILWGSEVGYVLYGSKPICFEGYGVLHPNQIDKIGSPLYVALTQGIKLWKQLKLPVETPRYEIILEDSLFLCVNKQEFKNIFERYESLFRYTLGPNVTAEKLLKQFRNGHYLDALKNDNVLIGLSLGFGFENCLFVSRLENLREALYRNRKRKIHPFFEKRDSNFKPPYFCCSLEPNMGYPSIQNEIDELDKKIDFASPLLTNYSPQLIFGKVLDQEKNKELLKNYENTQLYLINVLDHPNWLEEILTHFFQEPTKLNIHNTALEDRINYSNLVYEAILMCFQDLYEKSEDSLNDFVEGMRISNKRSDAHYLAPFPAQIDRAFPEKSESFLTGFNMWSYYKFNQPQTNVEKVIDQLKSDLNRNHKIDEEQFGELHRHIFEMMDHHEETLAKDHFQKIELKPHVKCLVKGKLYYEPMCIGKGEEINAKSNIEVSYTLETIYGNIIAKEEHYNLDLKRAIRGFREAFLSMKKDEEGLLYIHPDWGIKDYHSPPYFSPYLIAKFKIH